VAVVQVTRRTLRRIAATHDTAPSTA
jgi:hypothetical protein